MILSKRYRYIEPGDHDEEIQITITGAQIYTKYWAFWRWQMIKAGRPKEQLTTENCIQDFVTEHWAWEVLEKPDETI